MAEEVEKQDGQKTIVAFIAGLLIGGLLVWVFASPTDQPVDDAAEDEVATTTDGEIDDNDEDDDQNADDSTGTRTDRNGSETEVNEGDIVVNDQRAGRSVNIEGATFPRDNGWIAVRTYENGQLGNILGAARFSKEQGLTPDEIRLLSPTVAGRTYAVVFFTEDGDRQFNLASDTQIGGVWKTFQAQ